MKLVVCSVLVFLASTMFSASLNAQSSDELLTKARAVLAQLDGEIRAPGLKERVEVIRDTWGIPHIYAANQDDLFFAQGFVTAQDRLFQLDLWRRMAVGETAELFGEEAIEADRFARLIRYRGDMEAEWQSYAPDTKAIATAFTRGINAYIVEVQHRLPIEFQILGVTPKKWQPEDILGRMSGIVMTSNWQREVARARLVAAVGVEQARRIAPTDPPLKYGPVEGLDLTKVTPDILKGYIAATRPYKFPPATVESNNWVVDGTMSASGRPLLANDPHRSIALPSLRYLVHLHAPGWNVIGSGEPALPGVALGHNEHIAWGFTIVGTDQADLYIEQTKSGDPRQYKMGGDWQAMEVERTSIRVRGRREPVETELRFTRHGPVIYQDEARKYAVALKWVGSEPGGAAYLGGLSVARAQNRQEFVSALKRWKSPCENFVYADVDGNIGWVAAALTPIRNGWDGLLPVPGGEGKYEWQGFLDVEQLPQSFNPDRHWIATANHNILPPGYSHKIAYEWAAPNRYGRIEERLNAASQLSVKDFQSIQHDNTSLPGRVLAKVIAEAELPKELATFSKLFANWGGNLAPESGVAPLYAVWLQELSTAFFNERVPQEARTDRGDLRSTVVLLEELQRPTTAIMGEPPVAKRDELVRKTFAKAVERTKKLLGDDPASWRWGKLHTARLEHPLASLGSAFAEAFNLNAVARGGDVNSPNNTRHDDNFRQVHGASYREIFDLADWDRGVATSVPGQSGQRGSPHYADLLPLWAQGEYFPLAYSRQKVEQVAKHRLTLKP
jgi:penicillin G amidase